MLKRCTNSLPVDPDRNNLDIPLDWLADMDNKSEHSDEFLDNLIDRHLLAFSSCNFLDSQRPFVWRLRALFAQSVEARTRRDLISYVPRTREEAVKKLAYFAAFMIKSESSLDSVNLERLLFSVREFDK